MKKTYTITVEVTASNRDEEAAFSALLKQAFTQLTKDVEALKNDVSVRGTIAEVNAPAPAPAPKPQ